MTKWNTETAQWYADKYGEYATNKLSIDNLQLNDVGFLVDIGCGTGCALRHAALKLSHGHLIGIDPVPRMIEIAKEQSADNPRFASIEYLLGSAESIPLADESADLVLAFDSFDHWEHKEKGIGEVFRVLKPGGKLAMVKDGGAPSSQIERAQFLNMLMDAGFSLLSESELNDDEVSCVQWVFDK